MKDDVCVQFLQWCLPRLNKRWPGFRKVRNQVCKRIARRMQELDLRSTDAYRAYLGEHPDEWDVLDTLCRITISRFYRDRGVFDALRDYILPELAEHAIEEDARLLHCWSAGCASGEEVYTLRIIWRQCLRERYPTLDLHVTATDADAHMLGRAQTACYQRGTLKELPEAWLHAAFEKKGEQAEEPYGLRAEYRHNIEWFQQDIRETMPEGAFHLILCRNLVFTYFEAALQRTCLKQIAQRLHTGSYLVLGKHESLPEEANTFTAWDEHKRIYQKT